MKGNAQRETSFVKLDVFDSISVVELVVKLGLLLSFVVQLVSCASRVKGIAKRNAAHKWKVSLTEN